MPDAEARDTVPIVESLRTLAVPLDHLEFDAENARRGDISAVRRSLNAFGQRKPVVAKRTGKAADGRPTGIVIAGNTTLAAAIELEWPVIAAVFVDDDALTARAYALADNRTGELASWDENQLAESLLGLKSAEFDLTALGWTDTELADLLKTPVDLTSFREPDETVSAAGSKETTACPQCGYEFVP